jgi:hypothetical protein
MTAFGEEVVDAASGLTPLHAFELSFIIASVLSLGYAIAFPILVYAETGIVLFSDVSVYFLIAAVAFFLTGRAFDFTDQRLRR